MQDATGRVSAVKSAGMMTRITSKTIAAAKGSPGLKEAATELLEEHTTTSALKVTSNHSDKTPQVPTTVQEMCNALYFSGGYLNFHNMM